MGYKPTSRTFLLHFEAYEGLEVIARSAQLAEFLTLMDTNVSATDFSGNMRLFEFVEKRIVSWNIDHPEIMSRDENGKCTKCGLAEGESLPATAKHMLCLDFDFIMEIIGAWLGTIASVTVPKGLNLSNGANNTETLMNRLAEMQSLAK